MNSNFYPKIGGAAVASATAALSLLISYSNSSIIAALLIVTAVTLIKSAEKESRKTGRTDRMKASLKALKPAGELTLISSALVLYSTPVYIAVSVLALYSFSEIFSKSSDSKEFFGEEVRIGLFIIAVLGYTVNVYVLFYGLLAIGVVAAIDSAYMLYNSFSSEI